MSRALLSIGAVQLLILLTALVRSKLLSVLLGPADFGVTSTIDQIVLTLVTLGALGVPFTALKFMSRSHSEDAAAFRRSFAGFLRLLVLLAAAVVAVVLLVLAVRPGAFGDDLAPHRTALAIAVLGVPAVMLNVLFVNSLAAAQRATAAAVVGLVSAASLMTGAVIGELAGGIPGLYVGTLAAGVASTVATLAYLQRSLGPEPLGRPTGIVQELRREPEIVSYALLTYVAMGAYSLAMLAARYVVLDDLGAVQAGLFQALLSLALTVGAVMTPMNSLFLAPFVNRRLDVATKVAAADDFARKMAVLLALAALPMVLFPRLVLTILYSAEFVPAAGMLFVFVAWQCVYQVVNVYMQLLIGLDDIRFLSLATCVGFALAAALFPALVPAVGLAGAALALLLGMLLVGAAAAARLRTRFASRVHPGVLLRTAISLLAVVLAGALFDGASEWTLSGALARVVYALGVVVMLWLVLQREERRALVTGVARLLSRRVTAGASAS